MTKRIARPITVLFLCLAGGVVLFYFFHLGDSRNRSALRDFSATFESNREKAIESLVEKLTQDRAFLLWLGSYLDGADKLSLSNCAAAHAYSIAEKSEFGIPRSILFKAFRYRYFSRLPILKSESIASAVAHIDFENPTTYADIGDFESLFWFSFFSLSVMEQYFRVYGFEKFQQLLSAIIYYPYEREAEGPFPKTSIRTAAFRLISMKALRKLVEGNFDLPRGVSVPAAGPPICNIEPPVPLENEYGWEGALEWYKEGMKRRPDSISKYLVNLASLNRDDAREIVAEALAYGVVSPDAAELFIKPCYENGIPLPDSFIEKGLNSPDELTSIYSMMSALNLEGSNRVKWVRELLARKDIYVKHLLIHRLQADDLDAGAVSYLKNQFALDFTYDWGISRMEALIIAAKIYEIYGEAGLIDLLNREIFRKYPKKAAELIEMFGGGKDIVSFSTMLKWLPSLKGSPVWWVMGSSLLPDEAKPEEISGIILSKFYELIDKQGDGIPPQYWRACFVADSLDPRPRFKKDIFFPLRFFGFLRFDEPYEILESYFRRGDATTVELALKDKNVRRKFFQSFMEQADE